MDSGLGLAPTLLRDELSAVNWGHNADFGCPKSVGDYGDVILDQRPRVSRQDKRSERPSTEHLLFLHRLICRNERFGANRFYEFQEPAVLDAITA